MLAVALTIALLEQLMADEPQSSSANDGVVPFMMSQVSAYKVTVGKTNRAALLHPSPVLRWTNPVSGVDHGILVIWHDQNRPVIASQVFKIPKPVFWLHECQSLVSEPLQCQLNGKAVWAPTRGMLEYKVLESESKPSERAAQRLTQARAIARRFEATEDFRNTPEDDIKPYVLRLNAQPVYQYESAAYGVTGGYLFAFVNGTDPEVLLIVESYQSDSQTGWRYLLSPMTCWGVAAKLDGNEVWSIPEQYGKTNLRDPYFTWVADPKLLETDPTK